MSRYDARLGRQVYVTDFGETVDFSLEDSAESIMTALDSFYAVHIQDYYIRCDDSVDGALGGSYMLYLQNGGDFFEYAPDLYSVHAILEGIRAGYFDPKKMS
ncbi:conserved hypothetical protein [Thiomonas arsenitoxydans]|uniref:Uncharacterized protein n=1 Tax=Thiomonas arsenitoxydans (strain DSM 22701 / CIP 110005 / 3As) TaxID=426114 RepID=D6CVT1_THIA3|nr:hypothetical protein [Thiomonas arsenitoxydans]CAZ90420.1 hypothetical protein THI_p0022 [Thiomonas arsenitoxydans]CQR32730.1 conserved hypothetical protein [Thiomonas arsenitoxydans]CQR45768.1 conserved protein of unknown function [Thiomonas sp. CB3]